MHSFNPRHVVVDLNSLFSNMQMAQAAEQPIRYVVNEARRSNLLPLITYESFGEREHDLVYCAQHSRQESNLLQGREKKKIKSSFQSRAMSLSDYLFKSGAPLSHPQASLVFVG